MNTILEFDTKIKSALITTVIIKLISILVIKYMLQEFNEKAKKEYVYFFIIMESVI